MQTVTFESITPRICPEEGTKGVAYDTAWTSRVKGQNGKSLFPECLSWIIRNQKQDGSWGGRVENFQDRIISTLSAIIALKELGGKKYAHQISQGETYIWDHVKKMEDHFHRLIGVELLYPSLMEQAEALGFKTRTWPKNQIARFRATIFFTLDSYMCPPDRWLFQRWWDRVWRSIYMTDTDGSAV